MVCAKRSTLGSRGGCSRVAALLEVEGLQTHFFTRDGIVRAVDGVSLSVAHGETLAVVGESGCGKSVTALSILRLIASPPGRMVAGRVVFGGRDLLALTEDEMRAVRGDAISMIFQEPMTSLNPALTVGRQIAESLVLHRGLSQREAMAKAVEMLRVVVMYAGRKVEEAPVEELFARPRHPYTRGLLGSMPHLGDSVRAEGGKRLVEIPGMVPSLKDEQPGCLFSPRCPNAVARCLQEMPPLSAHGPGHWAACWNPVQ